MLILCFDLNSFLYRDCIAVLLKQVFQSIYITFQMQQLYQMW